MDIPVGPWADVTQWSLLVGFLYPFVAALVKQTTLSKRANTVIAAVFALITAYITVVANGDFSWDTWAATGITIFTVASATYAGLWKPLGVEQPLEEATTVYKRPELAARRNTTTYDGRPQ